MPKKKKGFEEEVLDQGPNARIPEALKPLVADIVDVYEIALKEQKSRASFINHPLGKTGWNISAKLLVKPPKPS